ncbi:lytic transglycosylase domain-containing protein [Natronincola ferrireducens]|uniref:Soluble lytic murein transglycosylase n=1 Tax=Natronincola ferrireducens TaxID=393762 RepID=A0A1G9AAV7_9FIRM|nr:lytic transglycosylase domain-containing protein [Natronincola ferrireducens]SDK23735.1 soluble lytic murein transglycosylase [Natronincola ferrireducens]
MLIIFSKKIIQILVTIILIITVIVALQNGKWLGKVVYPFHYKDIVEIYATEYEVDPYLVAAIIRNESKFNPYALSRRDAKGLMQIAPITGNWAAERMSIEDYREEMLYNPDLNIKIGCWYLNILHREFNNNLQLIIAAYNAGNGNVSRWLENPEYSRDGKTLDEIPFGETRIYLKKVQRDYRIYTWLYGN